MNKKGLTPQLVAIIISVVGLTLVLMVMTGVFSPAGAKLSDLQCNAFSGLGTSSRCDYYKIGEHESENNCPFDSEEGIYRSDDLIAGLKLSEDRVEANDMYDLPVGGIDNFISKCGEVKYACYVDGTFEEGEECFAIDNEADEVVCGGHFVLKSTDSDAQRNYNENNRVNGIPLAWMDQGKQECIVPAKDCFEMKQNCLG